MEENERAGKTTVRLHTGDPCLYGAIREQMDELDRRGLAYDDTPGVSSFCGAGLREPVLTSLAEALDERLRQRAGGMRIAALFFSNRYGVLGKTPGAEELLALHRAEREEST